MGLVTGFWLLNFIMRFNKKDFIDKVKQLLRENTSPAQIALGAAIGVFIGVSPFFGLHTLIAIAVALMIKKANKIAMLLGIQISLPPLVPVIYFLEYKIGKLILLSSPKDDHYAEKFSDTDLSLYAKFNLKFFATFVGSLVIGLIFSTIAFVIVKYLVQNRRAKAASTNSQILSNF